MNRQIRGFIIRGGSALRVPACRCCIVFCVAFDEPWIARWVIGRWIYSVGSQLYLASARGQFRVAPATLEGVPVGTPYED